MPGVLSIIIVILNLIYMFEYIVKNVMSIHLNKKLFILKDIKFLIKKIIYFIYIINLNIEEILINKFLVLILKNRS